MGTSSDLFAGGPANGRMIQADGILACWASFAFFGNSLEVSLMYLGEHCAAQLMFSGVCGAAEGRAAGRVPVGYVGGGARREMARGGRCPVNIPKHGISSH